MTASRALVVDDDSSIRLTLAATLAELGYTVIEAQSAEDALRQVQAAQSTFRLIVTDFSMPGASGAELIRMAIAKIGHPLPIFVLLTGCSLDVPEIQQLRSEVHGKYPVYFVAKSGNLDELHAVLNMALRKPEPREKS